MIGYAADAQSMTVVAAIIERARLEGRDLATALRIARATLDYLSRPVPDAEQVEALKALDHHLTEITNGRVA